jgi:hypothetical protein
MNGTSYSDYNRLEAPLLSLSLSLSLSPPLSLSLPSELHERDLNIYTEYRSVVHQTNELRGLSLRANYTDRATATCRRS